MIENMIENLRVNGVCYKRSRNASGTISKSFG